MISTFLRRSFASQGSTYQRIHDKLTSKLEPSFLEIRDDSHKHASHKAMQGLDATETHFAVTIVSACFEGQLAIQRHRLVNSILDEELKSGVHAL